MATSSFDQNIVNISQMNMKKLIRDVKEEKTVRMLK